MSHSLSAALIIGDVNDNKCISTVLALILGSFPRKFRVTCVWAKQSQTAKRMAEVIQSANAAHNDMEPVSTHFPADESIREIDGKGYEDPLQLTQSLMEVLHKTEISTLFLAMNATDQLKFLSSLFCLTHIPKHVFSLALPGRSTREFARLKELHESYQRNILQKRLLPAGWTHPSIWVVFEPGRYESFLNKVLRILPDIGEIQGGSLVLSDVPLDLDPDLNVPDMKFLTSKVIQALEKIQGSSQEQFSTEPAAMDIISRGLMAASGMFRKIFSTSVSSIVGFTMYDNNAICAAVTTLTMTSKIHANVVCAITGQVFELVVWGSAGRIRVSWNPRTGRKPTDLRCPLTSSVFECSRESNHFEHPTMMPPTGVEWCISLFADIVKQCISADPQSGDDAEKSKLLALGQLSRNEPREIWIDLAVVEGTLSSNGTPVCFRPVNV